MRQRDRWLSIGLLLLLFGFLVIGSRHVSPTTDEMAHITAGYTTLTRGPSVSWFAPFHITPPLINVLQALPAYLMHPLLPLETMAGWGEWWRPYVAEFAATAFGAERAQIGWHRSPSSKAARPVASELLPSRLVTMGLTVILAALIARWATEMWGGWAGVLSLCVLTFDPTLIAHGRLATTDVGVVALGTVTLYLAWRWLRSDQPIWQGALSTGLAMGATLLAKSSGVVWGAGVGLMMLIHLIRRYSARLLGRMILFGGLVGLVTLGIVWMGYGFTWGRAASLGGAVPAPTYWEILLAQTGRQNNQIFALGMRHYGRWWWYLPVAFMIKNPLPLLLGVLLGLLILVRRKAVFNRPLLASFPLCYGVVALNLGTNIGYRYMLPIHPFLYLLVGWALSTFLRSDRRWRWLIGGAGLAWLVTNVLVACPNEIAFFNELVGGSYGGYRYLSDSNVEWGQSAHRVDRYVEANPDVRVRGPETPMLPEPGRYVVNATQLQGTNIDDPNRYEWFRHRDPTLWLNETLMVFDVPPHAHTWLAQCTVPVAPMDDTAMGDVSLRRLRFDCTESWLYPSGGTAPGLYALHHELIAPPALCLLAFRRCSPSAEDPFMQRHVGPADVSFEHPQKTTHLTSMILFELPADRLRTPLSTRLRVADAVSSPDALDTPPVQAPVALNGGISFLGVTLPPSAEPGTLEVETWWKVQNVDDAHPLSIMAHLIRQDGMALDTADGLGVEAPSLAPGDVFVQRHRFAGAEPRDALWLRTGIYELDTGMRWKVAGEPDADACFVPLSGE